MVSSVPDTESIQYDVNSKVYNDVGNLILLQKRTKKFHIDIGLWSNRLQVLFQ